MIKSDVTTSVEDLHLEMVRHRLNTELGWPHDFPVKKNHFVKATPAVSNTTPKELAKFAERQGIVQPTVDMVTRVRLPSGRVKIAVALTERGVA